MKQYIQEAIKAKAPFTLIILINGKYTGYAVFNYTTIIDYD